MSHRHVVAGWELRSDLPFSLLDPAPRPPPALPSIALHLSSSPFEEPSRWLHTERYRDTGKPWRALGARGDDYLVRCFGRADFLLERGSHEARVFLAPAAPIDVIEPLFLELVLPLWWSLLGRSCLHASAVAWAPAEDEPPRAIAFAGPSGAGKSTLATSFATSLAEARGLIADDCLVLDLSDDAVIAHPGHRAVRLRSDSAEVLFDSAEAGEVVLGGDKRRVEVGAAAGAIPVARIYMVEPRGAEAPAQVASLRPRDAITRLAACLFRIDPEDRSRLAGELDVLERIAASTRVARLQVPRRFDALSQAHAVIAADLAPDLARK